MIYPPGPSTEDGIYIKLQIIYNLILIIDCYQDVKRLSTSITKNISGKKKLSYPTLKGSYDAISSFPLSFECYKLFVHR